MKREKVEENVMREKEERKNDEREWEEKIMRLDGGENNTVQFNTI